MLIPKGMFYVFEKICLFRQADGLLSASNKIAMEKRQWKNHNISRFRFLNDLIFNTLSEENLKNIRVKSII
jgi:hypothetical protein